MHSSMGTQAMASTLAGSGANDRRFFNTFTVENRGQIFDVVQTRTKTDQWPEVGAEKSRLLQAFPLCRFDRHLPVIHPPPPGISQAIPFIRKRYCAVSNILPSNTEPFQLEARTPRHSSPSRNHRTQHARVTHFLSDCDESGLVLNSAAAATSPKEAARRPPWSWQNGSTSMA